MLRALNPNLGSPAILDILVRTGWRGNGVVTRGLDAYAALLDVMGGELPIDPKEAPGPVPLVPAGAPNQFALPGGSAILSGRNDRVDRWRLDVTEASRASIALEWYERLGDVRLVLTAEDGSGASVENATTTPGTGRIDIAADVSPGIYVLTVTGPAPTGYELSASLAPLPIVSDEREPNNSFESATCITWRPSWLAPFAPFGRRCLGPGGHDLTLHRRLIKPIDDPSDMDVDFFSFVAPRAQAGNRPKLFVQGADHPVDVTLFDAAQNVVQTWPGVRSADIDPGLEALMYLRVSGARPTRYSIVVAFALKLEDFPERETIPEWWNGPIEIPGPGPRPEWAVDLTIEDIRRDGLAFDIVQGTDLTLTLVDMQGQNVSIARAVDDTAEVPRVRFDTSDLPPAAYILRVTHADEHATGPVRLRVAPPVQAPGLTHRR